MSPLTDPIGPDLTATLRALKLGKLTATLPERLTLARQTDMPHADFLQLILSDEVARREAGSIALRAKNAGLDPAMRTETWDPTAAIRYDQRLWNELVSLRFLDGPHGALILGPVGVGKSAVGTLVERTSRYVLLLHLPAGRGAAGVEAAMRQAITTLPGELFRTITWDQGKEMAYHAQFTIATGIQVYFCDPHKPWQRGSNENTNGLLRQYLPKSTDLSVHSAEDIARIARSLNNRPRKTLGYMKPSEKLAELLAHTG